MQPTKVLFPALFLFVFLFSTCGEDDDLNINNYEIWSGPTITFEKANGADPTEAVNQDRITDKVWITRGNNGGQIYNVVTETEANQSESPAGTLWALGTTADINNLTFDKFRATIKPQDAVGENLVLLLVEDQIAIDIVFTEWVGNQAGGFTYERSSQ